MNQLNIIILDYKEDTVKWLNPNVTEIIETSKKDACRKIELTYPYEEDVISEDSDVWYKQGNKIYVPGINGIKSCLYVINTEYEIDFWNKNTVKLEAEEVITELNYDVIYFEEGSVINITLEKLDEWFGSYYDITGMDTLSSNRKQITPEGVMTKMSLLRLIEEETGRIFITDYDNEENTIVRSLYLANPDSMRFVSQTATLDLNYNLESLEFKKSEENTYTALAPIFGNSVTVNAEDVLEKGSKISSDIVANAELRTENRVNKQNILRLNEVYSSLEDSGVLVGSGLTSVVQNNEDIIQEWLDYEVMEGQEIPMILQEDEEGNIVSTATWSAPFEKSSGELYIKYNGFNQTEYTNVHPYNESKAPPQYKIGTENTNETIVEAIYNELALSLLNKLSPDYELEIEVKDIQQLLGLDSLGYQLHESLQVRVPNFNYFLPCRITETVKNLHNVGENKIRIETEVTSIYDLQQTAILSENRIISANDKGDVIGGKLVCGEENLPNQYVVMSIKLVKAYTETELEKKSNVQQVIYPFDPVNETYVFSEQQISNLEKAMRNVLIKDGWVSLYKEYRLRDITGAVYSVPYDWAISIYNARNQIYSNNELYYGGLGTEGLGKGFFDDTVSVHYYPNAKQLHNAGNITFTESKKYYASMFYDYNNLIRNQIETLLPNDPLDVPVVTSSERQNGPTCLPASLSNVTSLLKDYHTEYELALLMGTTKENGTYRSNANKIMKQLGFACEIVEVSLQNILDYVGLGWYASVDVDASLLGSSYFGGIYEGEEPENHAVTIIDWYWMGNTNTLKVSVLDPNIPVFNPLYSNHLTPGVENWVDWSIIENAAAAYYENNTWYYRTGGTKHMTIIHETEQNLSSVEEVTGSYVITQSFNPELKEYTFELSAVNTSIKKLMNTICNSNVDIDIMSSSTTITTATNTEIDNISMWWLRALSYAAMYYYQSHNEKTKDILLDANRDSDSMKYYNHFNRSIDVVGSYDWFSPCYPNNRDNIVGYICSTLLFNLGLAYSPMDFLPADGYTGLEQIGKKIVEKAGSTYLNAFTVPLTSENINKYLKKRAYHDSFMSTVCLVYAYDSTLDNIAALADDYYPLMLYNKEGSNIDYMNILSRGNSLTNRYNTLVSDATNYNPYGRTTITNILSWNNSISNYLQAGDKGTMLVISYYTKTELEDLQ